MDGMTWTLMRVRRIRYTKTLVHRRTDEPARGTRRRMDILLREAAVRHNLPLTGEGGHRRLYVLRVPDSAVYPQAEEMLVVAPATVESKSRANFEHRWSRVVTQNNLF